MADVKVGLCGQKTGVAVFKGVSSVYKSRVDHPSDGQLSVAVKEYVLPSCKDDEDAKQLQASLIDEFLQDFAALVDPSSLPPHPNLARYFGACHSPTHSGLGRLFVTVEWIEPSGKLKGPMPEAEVRHIAVGVCQALSHLHRSGFTHGDLRPSNVVLTHIWPRGGSDDPQEKHVVVTDYSIAKKVLAIMDPGAGNATIKVKPHYCAPEAFTQSSEYDPEKFDTWMIGATLLELLSGKLPFSELDPTGKGNIAFKIVQTRSPPRYPEGISTVAATFLNACFTRDFSARPTATELLQYEWLEEK
jgi:serine/threonine protein kinase